MDRVICRRNSPNFLAKACEPLYKLLKRCAAPTRMNSKLFQKRLPCKRNEFRRLRGPARLLAMHRTVDHAATIRSIPKRPSLFSLVATERERNARSFLASRHASTRPLVRADMCRPADSSSSPYLCCSLWQWRSFAGPLRPKCRVGRTRFPLRRTPGPATLAQPPTAQQRV